MRAIHRRGIGELREGREATVQISASGALVEETPEVIIVGVDVDGGVHDAHRACSPGDLSDDGEEEETRRGTLWAERNEVGINRPPLTICAQIHVNTIALFLYSLLAPLPYPASPASSCGCHRSERSRSGIS